MKTKFCELSLVVSSSDEQELTENSQTVIYVNKVGQEDDFRLRQTALETRGCTPVSGHSGDQRLHAVNLGASLSRRPSLLRSV